MICDLEWPHLITKRMCLLQATKKKSEHIKFQIGGSFTLWELCYSKFKRFEGQEIYQL